MKLLEGSGTPVLYIGRKVLKGLYVMNGGNEQRAAIKCCFKAGLPATETLALVQNTYGNEAVNRLNVFRWYSRFRDGR